MSFLKRMFGKQDPVEEIQRLYKAKDWAGVLAVGRRLAVDDLDDEVRSDIEAWQADAGDCLAKVNLEEGDYAWRDDSLIKAREHFQLASEQAHDEQLKQAIEERLSQLDQGKPATAAPVESPASCGTGCGPTCGPTEELAEDEDADLDMETRLELLLATYPPELAARYAKADPTFCKAWLAVHDGDDEQARQLFEQVPQEARDSLYLAEVGALLLRSKKPREALQALQQALQQDPGLFHAFDTMVAILAGSGRQDELVKLLKQKISENLFAGYCWARLAEIHARKQEFEPALTAGLKAIEEGAQDPGALMLCTQLLERAERYDEAEALLSRLPAGGCGGGAHPMLAEFWLRREKNLTPALESFKGALRQERDNPRWMLRIAQTYLAKGWRKEAEPQLEALMARGDLTEELRKEVTATAEKLQS